MTAKLHWGILGTGTIAKTFAAGVAASTSGVVVAVGSRDRVTADAFGDAFGVRNRHGSYESLLADPDVQAVYIATPHTSHKRWAIAAAEAKKHILCEKPIGVSAAEAEAIIAAARKHDVFLMEAFMYRCHPQIAKALKIIRSGLMGAVRVIQATFSFHWPIDYDARSRLLANELAGGGILDVGCYPTSICRLIAGAAVAKPFAEPSELVATGYLGRTGVDEWTVASAKFPGLPGEPDILAQLSTGVQCDQENVVRIYGSQGWLLIPDPWIPSRDGASSRLVLNVRGRPAQEIVVDPGLTLYALEADTVAANLHLRQAPSPAMSWDDTLGNMRMLDRWRAAIGLKYAFE
ncbi:Gfo/Idh/MocA family protein [Humisphaera borealis]|uniref:Gfo/Idh/MocA family oxidoreductase n=1 Tax=Humisphaera borealis TaxID=2807512 RepID=A0A7M2WQT0_9BACT|nr:Gfo/Idh/MocA family oxidoreductase [Humisphaera borealis]QOV87826.1 Gfo/Idh/MocA family oxidoreductase [Humisphaera borealis]